MNKNYDQAGLLNDAANLQEYGLSERQILAAQAQAAATLAVAYEQRTANLIALFGEGNFRNLEDAETLFASIRERLGLA